MKLLSAAQLREADAYTIAHEPIRSIDLMERAALACFHWIQEHYDKQTRFLLFCGTGNNGGDALALARMLFQDSYDVIPYIIHGSDSTSEDCHVNEARLLQLDLSIVRHIHHLDDIASIDKDHVLIDGLFGTGLNKPVVGLASEVISLINESAASVISIDIPSGLFIDRDSDIQKASIVKARYTLTFQVMKKVFLFPEYYAFTGSVTVLDIGLSNTYINTCEVKDFIIEKTDIRIIAKLREPFSHKGTYGHALLITGSSGKAGSSILSARACLKSGVGLLTVHVPKSIFKVMPVAIPESMFSSDSNEDCFTDSIPTDTYDAIGVGCGIGTGEGTAKALKLLIQAYRYPTVFDADAINILAANKTWLEFIPPGSIFTPHLKEFERLVGRSSGSFERNQMQIDFAKKYQAYILLKGKYTTIACPDGVCFFNPTGNPGMATAGSGDVLTGIITSLLAQGHGSRLACLGGVYLHGFAGDLALQKGSAQSLIASDIIDNLGDAFRELE